MAVEIHYPTKVKEVFKAFDNIMDYEQLQYNFEYLEPEVLLEWLPSPCHCLNNLDGLICLILLPTVITNTQGSDIARDFQSQVTYARNQLTQQMEGAHYHQLLSFFQDLLDQPECKNPKYMDTTPTYTATSENLTPSETAKYYATLDELTTDYPEVELTPSVHESIKKKIIGSRPPPTTVSVPSHPADDGGSSYSGSSSTSRKHNKVKLRPRFSEKVIWDGRRTTFKPLMELLEGHLRQINGSYMITQDFLTAYQADRSYINTKAFYSKYQVNVNQARYDRQYLFGILQTVTRAGGLGENMFLHIRPLVTVFLLGNKCYLTATMMVPP